MPNVSLTAAIEKPIGSLGTPFTFKNVRYTPLEYIVTREIDGKACEKEGDQYLLLHIEIENLGSIASTIIEEGSENIDAYYNGTQLYKVPIWFRNSFKVDDVDYEIYPVSGCIYTGRSMGGWIAYYVPLSFDVNAVKIVMCYWEKRWNYLAWTLLN